MLRGKRSCWRRCRLSIAAPSSRSGKTRSSAPSSCHPAARPRCSFSFGSWHAEPFPSPHAVDDPMNPSHLPLRCLFLLPAVAVSSLLLFTACVGPKHDVGDNLLNEINKTVTEIHAGV